MMKLNIRAHRNMQGLTIEQLAEKAGISRSYLTELELGAKVINANRLEQIAKALGVRVTDLFPERKEQVAVVGIVGGDGIVRGTGGLAISMTCPPALEPDGVRAVIVGPDPITPHWIEGDTFFYRAVDDGRLEHALNRLALAEEKFGGPIRLCGVRRGSEPGLYHVESAGQTFWNRPIERIFPIEMFATASLAVTLSL